MGIEAALDYVRGRRDAHLEILFTVLRQPSVSVQGTGMKECADLLVDLLHRHGISARLIETDGAPVVYGEVEAAGPSAPTVLLYGHYDVQAPQPLDAWVTPPFQPDVRDGRIYARGVADNKGQHLCHVFALDALARTTGVPVNVKLVLEGEEEIGSPHLDAFAGAHRDMLATDLVVTADGSYHPSGRPVVCFGVRGDLGVELRLRTAVRDVHSGNFGNTVPDPTWRMIEVLHSLRDHEGRVAVEGFYDDIREPTDEELAMGAALPFDAESFAAELGLREPVVRTAEEYARAVMFSPTLTVAGMASGNTGDAVKTIVPGSIIVNLDIRLVADQSPGDVFDKLSRHIAAVDPAIDVRYLGSMKPSRTPPDSPLGRTVVEAVHRAREQEPLVVPSLGGSLPDAAWTETLGVPSIIVPYAAHDSANHAPNENLRLDDFYAGIETSLHLLDALGRAPGS